MVRWRWLWTRCRRCCYYCSLCTCSFLLLLAVAGYLGFNKWLLSQAGLTYGDELAADIPLETQGKLHMFQDDHKQEPLSNRQVSSHSPLSNRQISSHSPLSSDQEPPSADDTHDSCPTHYSQYKILFFIRLPKCASTSFIDLLRKLSQLKDFYLEFNPSGAYNWKDTQMKSVTEQVLRKMYLKRNLVYARHFYFVNFERFRLKNFTYLTIIRDPVDRVVSSYLYYHFSSKKHIQDILDPAHRGESLSKCIREEHDGCTYNLVTKYFCGHDYWCKYGDQRALDVAKSNLVKHFALVGIMEEMELSIKLMRRLLPQYFEIGPSDDLTLPALNKNEQTTSLSEKEREEIVAANSADVELYNFARQHLHELALNCGIKI